MAFAPWRDRAGRFSACKALCLAALWLPAGWMAVTGAAGGFGGTLRASLVYYTGVWSLWALLACLAVTPLARALRWPQLAAIRRMLGVGSLGYTLLHVGAYAALRKFELPAMALEVLRRGSLLVALLATLGLCVMGATSTDDAVRRLGGRRWKRLQQSVYLLAPLALLHFLLSPLAVGPLPFILAGLLGWLLAWRVIAHRGGLPPARTTLGLTVAAAAATCLFELAWLALYQALPVAEIARANFELDLGLSAAWTVLFTGLTVAALSSLRQTGGAPRPAPQEG